MADVERILELTVDAERIPLLGLTIDAEYIPYLEVDIEISL